MLRCSCRNFHLPCRPLSVPAKNLSSSRILGNAAFKSSLIERAEDEVDVCIVGGGPAGLSAAIRLKQLEREKGNEVRVIILEKGSEVGSHIVSGAVLEPRALNELIPDWVSMPDHPLTQPATSSRMLCLTQKYSIPIPHPPQMSNHGNYVVSLSQFTRWLAKIAENDYGVEIYPGFAGAQLLLSDDADSRDCWGDPVRSVQGVITNEVGLTKNYRLKSSFEPGMAFRAKVTLLAEGAHGSLSKQAISLFNLRKEAQPQTYGIGLKEVWRVEPENHRPGKVVHTLGWPLDNRTYGGGFVYHMDGGLVSLGLVIGLDYKNPYLNPYREFQQMKHHPYFRSLLSGPKSERLAYAARVINEGGLQSVPKLHFPGGALIGCSAGFVNIAKIKGTHNAMKSGMLAAEAAWEAVHPTSSQDTSSTADMSAYDHTLHDSWVHSDLYEVRNLRPSFSTGLGTLGGVIYSGIDSLLFKGRVPWTFKHHAPDMHEKNAIDTLSLDSALTEPASMHKPINYPPFEPPLSTDLLTSVSLTGTNHVEDQPVHLRVVSTRRYVGEVNEKGNMAIGAGSAAVESAVEQEDAEDEKSAEKVKIYVEAEQGTRERHIQINFGQYAGLLGRACPAGVYEYVPVEGNPNSEGNWNGHKLVINSQNCIHCKLCDVKVPSQDITWTVPEGGGGPKYAIT